MFAIGLTADTLQSLQDAGLNAPHFKFLSYSRIPGMNGAGKPVTMGPPTLTWSWDWMDRAQWTWLLDWLGAETSTVVFVRSVEEALDGEELSFKTWSAHMWRPTSALRGAVRVNVELRFSALVAVE